MGVNLDACFDEFNETVNKTVDSIRRGYGRNTVLKGIKKTCFDRNMVFEIAKCRIKARKKFGELADKLFFDEEGLRYSTPPMVAEYRAKRLRCKSVADVSCGVGVQLLFFSKHAEHTLGVEKNPFRLELARLNAFALGCDNVSLMQRDALDERLAKELDADCVFSDPARPAGEKVRKLETLQPNPVEVYRLYQVKTGRIAFELPPQISRENIVIDGEKEYTSLNFRLNRLALYTGELATCDVSAVSLPSEERVTDEDEPMSLLESDKVGDYFYEVDVTIIKSGLLSNLLGKIGFDGSLVQTGKRRTLLSSNGLYESAFLRTYVVRETLVFDVPTINKALKRLNARKATLRFEIDSKDYWGFRKKVEEGLNGEKHFYLFKVGGKAVIAEPSDIQK